MVKTTRYHYILRLLLVFSGINAVWYAAALLVNMPILPSPFAVYASLFQFEFTETCLNRPVDYQVSGI
ncbi:hypothetical protein [Paenibacillus zanthoxyli]|uniref:hypothetical protein n=1 Tax=Paenibacillus zanthoxyli TaxID=369399 RepID=UPI0004705FE2|nr:hypothetical protein [Paenibacillus zanthoxyli]